MASALNTFPVDPGLFIGLDAESLRRRSFELCWTAHGGSGLGLTWSEVEGLDAEDADWLFNAVGKRRKDEAAAIKAASGK